MTEEEDMGNQDNQNIEKEGLSRNKRGVNEGDDNQTDKKNDDSKDVVSSYSAVAHLKILSYK